MAKNHVPTKRWVRIYWDLFQAGGPIDDIVRSCRQSVGDLSAGCRQGVGEVLEDVPQPPVTMADRCMFIGMVCYVWHRLYDGWRGSSDPDVRLEVWWYDIDHELGMPGLCKAMQKHGWLRIEGKTLVGIDLRKHFGGVIEELKYEAGQTSSRRASVGVVSAGCRSNVGTREEERREEKTEENPPYPPQAGDGGEKPKKPPKLIPAYSPAFEAFWARYPTTRRTNKPGAWKIWERDQLERPQQPGQPRLLDLVMRSLEQHRNCEQWQDGYVPLPTTWLNQKRWSTDPPTRERSE